MSTPSTDQYQLQLEYLREGVFQLASGLTMKGYYADTDTPYVGGDEMSASALETAKGVAELQYLKIPHCTWSDYIGNTVARSNHRVLVEWYPELLVRVSGCWGSETLLLPVAEPLGARVEELMDLLVTTKSYPVLDDGDVWALQEELFEEALDSYLARDFAQELTDLGLETDEETAKSLIRDLVHRDQRNTEDGYVCEDAVSVNVHGCEKDGEKASRYALAVLADRAATAT